MPQRGCAKHLKESKLVNQLGKSPVPRDSSACMHLSPIMQKYRQKLSHFKTMYAQTSFVSELITNTVQLQVNISSWTAEHHYHVGKLDEDLNMSNITSTNKESNHCQNIYGANSRSLVSIPKPEAK